ncbi:MAG: C10 family peptidase [Muribaculaceae bacterium]
MKKTFIFISTALLLAACSESDVLQVKNEEPSESAAQSQIRTVEEAYEIASRSISWIDEPESRSVIRLLPSKDKVKIVKDRESRGECSDTLMYVINFEDEQGFAVIPASRNMPELLAVTESGSYDPEVGSDVVPFNDYMNLAINYYKFPIDTVQEPLTEVKYEEETSIVNYVMPRASFRWGQGGLMGRFCPNQLVGCGPLAVAMCMAYFKYPDVINLNYLTGMTVYPSWNEIVKHDSNSPWTFRFGDYYYDEDVPYENQDELFHICREIGQRSNAAYEADRTGTQLSSLNNAIKSFGFSTSGINNFENTKTLEYLSNGFLLVCGKGHETDNSGNTVVLYHLWTIDGYKSVTNTIYEYRREKIFDNMIEDVGWKLYNITTRTKNYAHHNWGYSGSCNGYFLEDVWDTSSAFSYDSSNIYNGYSEIYDFVRKYIIVTR